MSSVLFSTELTKPRSTYDDVDMVGAINGNNANYVYVRDPRKDAKEAWERSPPLEVLENYPSRKQKAEDGTYCLCFVLRLHTR